MENVFSIFWSKQSKLWNNTYAVILVWKHTASQLQIYLITSSALIGWALYSFFLGSKHDARFVSRGQRRDNAGGRSFLSRFQDFFCPRHTPRACRPSAGTQPHPSQWPPCHSFPVGTPSPQPPLILPASWLLGTHLPLSTCPVEVCFPTAWPLWTSDGSGNPRMSLTSGAVILSRKVCIPFEKEALTLKSFVPWMFFLSLRYSLEICFHLPNYTYVIVNCSL